MPLSRCLCRDASVEMPLSGSRVEMPLSKCLCRVASFERPLSRCLRRDACRYVRPYKVLTALRYGTSPLAAVSSAGAGNSTALQHTASGATAFQRSFEWPRDDLPRRLQRAPSGMTSGKTSHEDPGVEQLAGYTSTAYGHLQYANLRAFTVRKPPGQ